MAEIMVEGMTRLKLFNRLGANASHASAKLCQYHGFGRLQTVSMFIWSGLLKAVIINM
jgi:hypothetical protein